MGEEGKDVIESCRFRAGYLIGEEVRGRNGCPCRSGVVVASAISPTSNSRKADELREKVVYHREGFIVDTYSQRFLAYRVGANYTEFDSRLSTVAVTCGPSALSCQGRISLGICWRTGARRHTAPFPSPRNGGQVEVGQPADDITAMLGSSSRDEPRSTRERPGTWLPCPTPPL